MIHTSEVGGTTELDENLQSQDTDDRDDEADGEHEQDEELLALVEFQLGDDWHGKSQHDDVQDDVKRGRGPSLRIDVVTGSGMFAVPV